MGAEGMGNPTSDLGITWEQIAIAAICFLVLLFVLIALLRGLGRGRRKSRLLRETTREPLYQPRSSSTVRVDRRSDRHRPAADDRHRMEPSLVAGDQPPQESVSLEPSAAPESEAMVDAAALEQHLAYLSETQADMARTLKALKAQVDELRKSEAQNTQRLDETEQTLSQLRAESHTAFALLENIAGQASAAPDAKGGRAARRTGSADPVLPLDIPAGEQEEEDPSVTRARQAIEQLERQDQRRR